MTQCEYNYLLEYYDPDKYSYNKRVEGYSLPIKYKNGNYIHIYYANRDNLFIFESDRDVYRLKEVEIDQRLFNLKKLLDKL